MLGSLMCTVFAYPMAGLPVPSQCHGASNITPLPHLTLQGVAEAELEKDIGRTLKALIRSIRPEVGEELGGKRINPGGGEQKNLGMAVYCLRCSSGTLHLRLLPFLPAAQPALSCHH